MMIPRPLLALLLAPAALVFFAPGAVHAAKPAAPTAAQVDFFEKQVRPLLVERCYSCHSAEKNKTKGGLVVDSLEGLLKGGDSGPALVPGQPDKSLLVQAIRHASDELKMPPKGKLPEDQIAVLTDWVKQGAPWPGATTPKTGRIPGKITDEDRKWWAFQPLKNPAVPEVQDAWARTPIDRFLLTRLQAEGLKPSPPAERAALIRRVSFDLIGLPPTPEEVDAFVKDADPKAYEKLIDRLLASPRYGERWARHWLDLARYAESDGYRIDDFRPEAWRYRDYVIKSFNTDKPYNRFVQEQLAGDELFPDDPDALAGTGFLRHWIYEYNQRDVRTQWDTILNDVTDVTSDVFLGLGMGCARCHDHKFDPILQKDYFRLQAFFAPMLPRDDVPLATAKQREEYQAKLAAWEAATEEVRKEIAAIEGPARKKAEAAATIKFPEDIQAMMMKPVAERTAFEHQLADLAYRQVLYEFARLDGKLKDDDKKQLLELRRKLATFDAQKPAPLPRGLTVCDASSTAPPTTIPKKANAQPIAPGYLTLLQEEPATIEAVPSAPDSTGRRATLARWLTRPDHPLTTRVIVNRVWQYHFGTGLVATASDFGRLGEAPSHPELLDWLATRFVQDGWSFKQLHRLILTSSAYQQSATHPASELALRKDPENRLLWKMPTRRLDAEQVRDALLAVTGELDLTAGGPSVDSTKARRSIYTRTMRNTRDPLLDVFDAPEGFTSTAQRNVTTTPTQSLLMINSPYLLQRAKAMADRVAKDKHPSETDRIEATFRLALGRAPTTAEVRKVLTFLQQQSGRSEAPMETVAAFQSEKLPYREGRAAVMQPGGTQSRFLVPDHPELPSGDFTLEAFVLLKSTFDDASVRTIASHWGGSKTRPGWSLGVTSKKSAFKPQTLVLQFWGDKEKHGGDYDPLFSGLHIALNKPYFVAVSVRFDDPEGKAVTFYAKDLSNDDEPMQTVRAATAMKKLPRADVPFAIGGLANAVTHGWDGLIDDVRLSGVALKSEQLLLTAEGTTDKTIAYWQFEAKPGVAKDSTGHGHDIQLKLEAKVKHDPHATAFIDLCHVLLNANEFLYVD